MTYTQQIMTNYLKDIQRYVDNENSKKVISLINEMKNFYMTEQGLKTGKKTKKSIDKIEKPIQAIGKFIDEMPKIHSDKPVRHIFY